MPVAAHLRAFVPRMRGSLIRAVALLALGMPCARARASAFVDPLDAPAAESALADRQLLTAVAVAGHRLVAVGQRGHILLSDDEGHTWSQARVPVSTDLTAVHFPTPERGFAVGHAGVILATSDGGRTWRRQLDGRQLGQLLAARYTPEEQDRIAGLREQLAILAAPAADQSFLDVWFADGRSGFAVGAFNLVLHTDDGGDHWVPWLDRVENPLGHHVYAIGAAGGDVYAVGEQGLVRRLAPSGRRFEVVAVPYRGSLFGLAAWRNGVVAFGMRGTVLVGSDHGRRWLRVATGTEDAIAGAAAVPDGRLVLVTQGGLAVASGTEGSNVVDVTLRPGAPASSAAIVSRRTLILVGPGGVRLEDVP
ncbi:MAG TPA: YCF48-related protein [Anaeromyxobacteraceae bacterium]|nr:YCF48-related protein [Anaeromyxobacteraceae bacterium]